MVAFGPSKKLIWHTTAFFGMCPLTSTFTLSRCQWWIVFSIHRNKWLVHWLLWFIIFKIVGMWTTDMASTKHNTAKGAVRKDIPKWFCWRGVGILPVYGNHHSLLFSFTETNLSQVPLGSFGCSLPQLWVADVVAAPHACMPIVQCAPS